MDRRPDRLTVALAGLKDALTRIARPGSRYDREPMRVVNATRMEEARRAVVHKAN